MTNYFRMDFSKERSTLVKYLKRKAPGDIFLECDFQGLDLSGLDFSGCELINCSFRKATVTQTNFSKCKIKLVHPNKVEDLIGAKFQGTDFVVHEKNEKKEIVELAFTF